jgi:hypothetical protein
MTQWGVEHCINSCFLLMISRFWFSPVYFFACVSPLIIVHII